MTFLETMTMLETKDEFEHKENDKGNIIIKAPEDGVKLKFYKTKKDLADPDGFERFIKSCEKAIRSDPRYTAYKSRLMEQGFNRCAFYGKIDPEKITLEMHHGPIFNLYEIVSIVTDCMLSEDGLVCTMDVVNEVLCAHERKEIQTIMLSQTVHEMVHDGDIFTHFNQAFGNILAFVKRYKKGIRKEHLHTMITYIKQCESEDATDNDMLKVVKKIKTAIG